MHRVGWLVMLLLLVGSSRGIGAQALPHMRVGTNRTVGAAVVFYAADQGFFKRAGVDVDIQIVTNGAAAAAAVVSGALDVADGNVTSIALAHEKGLPLVYIAPIANYSSKAPTTVLVVDKSSPLTSGAELAGKTVAVDGLNNITQVATEGWIDAHGGDSHAVHFTEMPFSEMGPALERHTVDAAVISEPLLTMAKTNVRVLGACYDAIGSRFMVNGWFTTSDWAAKNPDAVRRFQSALSAAAAWANANPQLTDPILVAHTSISQAIVDQMTRSNYAVTRLDPALVQPQLDIAFKYGLLPSRLPARDLIYTDTVHTTP